MEAIWRALALGRQTRDRWYRGAGDRGRRQGDTPFATRPAPGTGRGAGRRGDNGADGGSRRLRRRRRQPTNDDAAEASSADAGDEPEGDDEAEAAPAASAPARKKKKKKKRTDADAVDPDSIRDRNRRVRARAAERRREKREGSAGARGLDASEMVDDALSRSTKALGDWVKDHFNIVQWLVVAALVGVVGWKIYDYRTSKALEKASDDLVSAVVDEQGRIAGEAAVPGEEEYDPRKEFKTDAARLDAAAKSYRAAAAIRPGSGTSIMARLGLAGVLYDQGKYDEARKEYEAVKTSELGQHDADVRYRAVEGIGMSLEAKGQTDAADKTYHELENADATGFSALGLYHEARLANARGDKDKAKALLKKAQTKLSSSSSPYQPTGYLDQMTAQLMRQIDPTAVTPPKSDYTAEDLSKLKAQIMKDPKKLQELLRKLGKGGTPGDLPEPPALPEAPAPAGSAP